MSQYIGKTISLISNSDIRYVGTLHEINSEQSTVSLKHVRSYGTEGRRGGVGEIPASEAIYEFIVFRGSDVKDLKIAEPAVPTYAQFQDPAIVQQQPYPSSFAQYPEYPPQQFAGRDQQQQQVQSPQQPAPAQSQSPKEAENNRGTQPSAPSAAAKPAAPETAPATAAPTEETSEERHHPHHHHHPRRDGERRGGGVGPRNRRKPVVGSDYDFAEHNAKFAEQEGDKDQVEQELGSTEEYYNKKTSFFDNISSSAKERTENPEGTGETAYQRRGEERKLNLETFGVAGVYHRGRGRGRGGNRGGRGNRGGYYRGGRGGGGGNYNNATAPNASVTTNGNPN